MDRTFLNRASDFAIARLKEAGNRLSRLPPPLQIVIIISSAQGIIDNGGLEYFYENDSPGNPPYSFFSDAYHLIGADGAAECIEKTASMFPFSEPHRFEGRRRQFLDRGSSPEFRLFSDRI